MTEQILDALAGETDMWLRRRQRARCWVCDGHLVGPLRDATCLRCGSHYSDPAAPPPRPRRGRRAKPNTEEKTMSRESIRAKLAASAESNGNHREQYPEGWKPKAGDELAGTITAIAERDGDYGLYPVYIVRTFDGEDRSVHAYHSVLAGELADQGATVGCEVGIAYGGKGKTQGGRDCHRYTVVVERPDDEPPASDVPADPEPEPPPAPADNEAALPF